VLVLGAGETARSAVGELSAIANVRVTVLSRTYDRAVDLASAHGAEARPWDALPGELATADVVIGCTGSQVPVIDADVFARARHTGAGDVLCVDLGLPRDFDSAVTSIPGVRLIDLDHIELETAARRADRARDLAQAESIVDQETERYMEWWRGRGVASTIGRLHAHVGAIRDAEVERALARLPHLDPHARAVIRDLAARMTGKLLHEPTLALKRDAEGVNMAVVVERLFALSDSVDFTAEYCAPGERVAHQDIHQESSVS
jgi:glutamyl-tRNA reductase